MNGVTLVVLKRSLEMDRKRATLLGTDESDSLGSAVSEELLDALIKRYGSKARLGQVLRDLGAERAERV